jgi:hypothetical protein
VKNDGCDSLTLLQPIINRWANNRPSGHGESYYHTEQKTALPFSDIYEQTTKIL